MSPSPADSTAPRRPPRRPLAAEVECIGDFDLLTARGVDLSEGGVCFDVDEVLPFEMRFTTDGRTQVRRAVLSWLTRREEGGYRLGLQFVDGPPATEEPASDESAADEPASRGCLP